MSQNSRDQDMSGTRAYVYISPLPSYFYTHPLATDMAAKAQADDSDKNHRRQHCYHVQVYVESYYITGMWSASLLDAVF